MLLSNTPPSAHNGRRLPVVAIDLTRAETWEVYCFAIAVRWLSSVARFRAVWRRRGLAQKLFGYGLSGIDFSSPTREETALDVLAVYQTACAAGVVVEFWNFDDRTPTVFQDMVNNDLTLADRLRGVLEMRASVQTRFAQEFPEYQPLPGEAAIRELWP